MALFFVQAARFLYATLYAHIGGANATALTADPQALANQPGVISTFDLTLELAITGLSLLLPIFAPLFGRFLIGSAVAAAVVAAGRVFMTANAGTLFGVAGAALALGAAALHMGITIGRRPHIFAPSMVLAFAGDQLIRLIGATQDITWSAAYLDTQTALSLSLFISAVLALVFEVLHQRQSDPADPNQAPNFGSLNLWGAFSLGGLFFLEFTAIGLPNIVARRAGFEYTQIAPFLVAATLLPLIPTVRAGARTFVGMFDGRYRGWVWFLMIGLLFVIGYRFSGPVSVVALCAVQFLTTLLWWWVVQPVPQRRFFLTGLGFIGAVVIFLLLTGAEFFTFEYAFVRGLIEPFASILRGMRGAGVLVAIVAAFIASLPHIAARKRLAWRGGTLGEGLAAFALLIIGVGVSVSLTGPIRLEPPLDPTSLRVGSLNLRGGYGLYFGSDLGVTAAEIRTSGIDILLLQEVEGGRLISGGVDQAAWLGRALNMELAYFGTNEGVQGLAILSRLPIETRSGVMLSAQSKATGVQFVRVRKPNGEALDLYNTHLSLIFRGGALSVEQLEVDQVRQIQEVLAFVETNRSDERAVIIGGTFNHAPQTDIYNFMRQQPQPGFIDPFADFPSERATTRRIINEPSVRVDYLWLRQVRPVEVGITRMRFSSHDMPIVKIAVQ
ncbi:MAG: hypothetical protein OHK0023_01840 [Anaerolineae bacterium]